VIRTTGLARLGNGCGAALAPGRQPERREGGAHQRKLHGNAVGSSRRRCVTQLWSSTVLEVLGMLGSSMAWHTWTTGAQAEEGGGGLGG
jgi:hypothetical protein